VSKPKAIIVDLDNTLALIGERDPYDGHLCATDQVCQATELMIRGVFGNTGAAVILLTGRNEFARSATERWLYDEFIPYTDLIMRDPSDWRPSDVYKLDMLDTRILPTFEVVFALDDDPKVVRAFRDRGIVCWHVRDWVEHPIKTGSEGR
jgi:hypothetical protein